MNANDEPRRLAIHELNFKEGLAIDVDGGLRSSLSFLFCHPKTETARLVLINELNAGQLPIETARLPPGHRRGDFGWAAAGRAPARGSAGASSGGLVRAEVGTSALNRQDVPRMMKLAEKAVEGLFLTSFLQKSMRLIQSFAFNCASFAAMNARMSADMSSSFSHCSLYKVTGKRPMP
jgi:hypothetical protein